MHSDTQTMPAPLNYDDYCLIPDDGRRHEIIHGVHYVSPSPRTKHQRILGNLYFLMEQFVRETKAGIVMLSPYDVVFSYHDVVQPDLLFIIPERAAVLTEKNAQGAPDLVIEILSEGNRRHDEVVKRKLYEGFGVKEYWIVDPELETIKVYRLEGDRFVRAADLSVEAGDELVSPLLPGFRRRLAEVFG